MNTRDWDPEKTIGSDIHVMREMIRHLGLADPKLVWSHRAELQTAFLDLFQLIEVVGAQVRGKRWWDVQPGEDTLPKTAP